MPLRRMIARERTNAANWELAALLAFTAGAVDVMGFMSLRQFTSHMSGNSATLAWELGTRHVAALVRPGLVLASFLAGAAFCAVLVNWERRRNLESLFAVPLVVEAALLATVPLYAGPHWLWTSMAVLAFSMGLQNAVITKISDAEIRTTHVTGTITDIGIELGRLVYWNRSHSHAPVMADRGKLALLAMLVVLFVMGGALGAASFPRLGFLPMLALAAMLVAPAVVPIAKDLGAVR